MCLGPKTLHYAKFWAQNATKTSVGNIPESLSNLFLRDNCRLLQRLFNINAKARARALSVRYTRACRQAKRTWLSDICAYELVHRLSSRTPRKPRQVRHFLDGVHDLDSELGLIRRYFTKLFGAESSKDCLQSHPWAWTNAPTCDNELEHALSRLPSHKEVPAHCPPGGVWRLALELPLVRDLIDVSIKEFPRKGIPTLFTQSTLALLAKANKSGRQVQHLRPIADNSAQVSLSIRCVRHLFEHLEHFGLLINYDKTQVLFRVTGKGSRSCLARYTRKAHGRRTLLISQTWLSSCHSDLYFLSWCHLSTWP